MAKNSSKSGSSGGGMLLVVAALWGVALAVIYQVAPGEPAWMTELPTIDYKDKPYAVERFVGGDGKTILTGRLFLPTNKKPLPPIIVLAHGLGMTQESGLESFVQAFNDAGFAAFTFDYATFGESEGWPRQQVKPYSHVADVKAALKHVQQSRSVSTKVDVSRIGLWGTSFAGGHALTVAASLEAQVLSAVVSNTPRVKSARESAQGSLMRDPVNTILGLVKVAGAFIKGSLSQLLFGKTTYIPLHGKPGSPALMQNPGDDQGYASLISSRAKDELGWKNLASVGTLPSILMYRPFDTVDKITVPTLVLPAENDTLCPLPHALEAVRILQQNNPYSKLFVYKNAGHFDVFFGESLKQGLKETVAFFKKHVKKEEEEMNEMIDTAQLTAVASDTKADKEEEKQIEMVEASETTSEESKTTTDEEEGKQNETIDTSEIMAEALDTIADAKEESKSKTSNTPETKKETSDTTEDEAAQLDA